jgi:peptidoglycan/LPS O-acetylase OafA/YrhL
LAWKSTGYQWQGDSGETYLAVSRLLSSGAFRIDFINSIDLMPITAGVAWTLVYEWAFYAALPIIAWCAKLSRFVILASLTLLVLSIQPIDEVNYASVFLVGMITAHLVSQLPSVTLPKGKWPSVAVGLLLLGAMLSSQLRPSVVAFVYLLPAFAAIAFGVDLFGILRTRPARLLGAASYSIYLLHGLILYMVLRIGHGESGSANLSTPILIGLMLALVVVVCVVSCLTYAVIERPMIARGRKISSLRTTN